MPEESPQAEPRTREGEILDQSNKLVKTFLGMNSDQESRLRAAVLTFLMAIGVGYMIWRDRNVQADHDAFMTRFYESESERVRLSTEAETDRFRKSREATERDLREFFSQEREKDRKHCDISEERQRKFFTEEREKDRSTLMAFTLELREMLTMLKKKGEEP
jgi:hypothetical protein